jgi:hypothetical protein
MIFLLLIIVIPFVIDLLQTAEDGSGDEIHEATLCVFFAPLFIIIVIVVHA